MSTDIKVQHKSGSVAELFQHDGNGEFIPVDGINPLPVAITGGNVSIVASDNIAKIGGVSQSGADVVDPTNAALRVSIVAGESAGGPAQLQIKDASNVIKDVGYASGDLNVPIQGTVTLSQPVSGTGNFNVTQTTGTNLHTVVDSGSISVNNLPATQPVSGSITVTQNTGTNLHTVVDSGNLTLSQPVSGTGNFNVTQTTGTNLHTVVDSGSISVNNLPATQPVSGSITVVQSVGTNLHTVVDSGNLTLSQPVSGTGNFNVTQTTGTNLHTVVDSGSISVNNLPATQAVSGSITAVQTTGTNLHTVVDSGSITLSKPVSGTGNFNVVQTIGTNLHTVVDSGNLTLSQPVSGTGNFTVTQSIGTNLHTVVDSGNINVSNLPTTIDGSIVITGSNVDSTIAETKGFITFGVDPNKKAKVSTLSYTGEAFVSSLEMEDHLKAILEELKKSNLYLSYIAGFNI